MNPKSNQNTANQKLTDTQGVISQNRLTKFIISRFTIFIILAKVLQLVVENIMHHQEQA